MEEQTKICQNCKNQFTIEPDDFDFYKKIKVPPPTFCPECRLVRRMAWRNERSLYKRTCGLCKRNLISIYSPDKPYVVYCKECFHGDAWNPLDYGMDVDFGKPFLEQFKELQLKVPRLYAFVFQNVESEYVNGAAFNKNCYLIFVSDYNEDSMYSYSLFNSKSTLDALNSNNCELCYEAVTCKKCYQVYFSEDCSNSQNLYFCKNCVNCHDCVGSVNLRNKQYCIFNEQYSKEAYAQKLKELHLESYKALQEFQPRAEKFWQQFISKYIHGYQNTKVVGDYIFNSKNVYAGYDAELLEDSKFINHANKAKNCYDGYVVVDGSEHSYEIVSAIALNNVKSGYCVWHDFDADYCDTCENSNSLFGCVGLRKKQYCILNKQYTKEEYEKLAPRIIEHMNKMPYLDAKGRTYGYGEFFPMELCPFAYNETVAQEHFPLTKSEAANTGYLWKDAEAKAYSVTKQPSALPDAISETSDAITHEVIGCAHGGKCDEQCTTAFKITPQEFQLYKQMNIPLPRLCPNCRHARRFKRKNPLKLWHRACQCGGVKSENSTYANTAAHFHGSERCPNEFETSYASERPEIIYCEQCYQAEVA